MHPYTFLWLAAMVVFSIAEVSSVSLVSIWFAVGSLAALLLSLFTRSFLTQLTVMGLVSAGCLVALRPLVKKYLAPHIVKTNVDSVSGQEGYALEPIDNLAATGRVKLGGMEWTARSSDGSKIPAESLVRVDRIEGVKVFVTPVKIPEELERR